KTFTQLNCWYCCFLSIIILDSLGTKSSSDHEAFLVFKKCIRKIICFSSLCVQLSSQPENVCVVLLFWPPFWRRQIVQKLCASSLLYVPVSKELREKQ